MLRTSPEDPILGTEIGADTLRDVAVNTHGDPPSYAEVIGTSSRRAFRPVGSA
jgi:hypothetical protein